MTEKNALISFFIITMLLLAGCDVIFTDTEPEMVTEAEISGSVAINRQGEGDASAKNIKVVVEDEDKVMEIDNPRGDFTLNLETGESYNIYAFGEGLGTSKVQNFFVDPRHPPEKLTILMQEKSSHHYDDYDEDENDQRSARQAPILDIDGIEDKMSANKVESITISSDSPIYEYHAALNNSFQKQFHSSEFTDQKIKIEDLNLPINYGGKPQQLAVFIVDKNNNITAEYFHLHMPDVSGDDLPQAPENIYLAAETHNSSINLLDTGESGEHEDLWSDMGVMEAEIDSRPEDTMLFNYLEWELKNPDVTSFNVYRSFNGDIFQHIDTVSAVFFDDDENDNAAGGNFLDVDTDLSPGEEVFYRIRSVNQSGESENYIEARVVPLPVFEVKLLQPSDEGTGINPELSWEGTFEKGYDSDELLNLGYVFNIEIRDQNMSYDTLLDPEYGYKIASLEDENLNTLEFSVGFADTFEQDQLRAGQSYQWNLPLAAAQDVIKNTESKTVQALSFASGPHYSRPEASSLEFSTHD